MDDILIISNYYPPEKGAASNRIEQLAKQLIDNNYNVTVVCPLPNYPKGEIFPEYKSRFSITENRDKITVKRLWIYPSISKNLVIRLFSVASFLLSLVFYILFKKTPNKVIVQSPPLLLSFIAVAVLRLKRKKVILNVSDLWPLAAIELKALKKNSLSHKISLFFEQFIYKNSSLILGQSEEIIAHIQSIFPAKKCYLYRNFPNHKVENLPLNSIEDKTIRIFYAGLLGIAQGIYELCTKIDLKNLPIELHLFGDGAEKGQIEKLVEKQKSPKIFFHGMKERQELHTMIRNFDIAIVPLKTRIYGSVPSKIFEYGALGFPILYFGGGEGETIVTENKLGWVVPVENYVELNKTLNLIAQLDKTTLWNLKENIFSTAKNQFDLKSQMEYLKSEKVF